MLEIVAWFCVFYVYHMLGVIIGYHRLLAHRSFRCPKVVEYFFVMGGYLAFQSSPIWWATVHRAHHRYVDTPLDPHSPRFGNFRSYLGWIFLPRYPAHINIQTQAPDLVNDPLYKLLERSNNWYGSHLTNSAIGFGARALLWLLFGWKIALASILAGLVVQQVPFALNVLCHMPKIGYRNYDTQDDSVNVWLVAILTLGEGWHNNHHAYPGSARSGFRWFEVDFGWLVIKSLEKIGLASRINDRHKPADLDASIENAPMPLVENLA